MHTGGRVKEGFKSELVTAGADATVYIWLLFTYIWAKNQTYTVASTLTVTGSVFISRCRLFLGQCGG